MKKVLIAHQSTIPHYRVDFFNELNSQLGPEIDLYVVEEKSLQKRSVFFNERVDFRTIKFKIHYTNTIFLNRKSKICFQTFFFSCSKYDLIIAENAINNLSYPLLFLYKIFGKKIAFWGHGRDLNNPGDDSLKRKTIEKLKLLLVRKSKGFFAYTESVKIYLEEKNVATKKIFNIENTIAIVKARDSYKKYSSDKTSLNKRLVFTGRLSKSKRIDFLLKVFQFIYDADQEFQFEIIGDGSMEIKNKIAALSNKIPLKYYGAITDDDKLAEIYNKCDLYVYPGYVGLGVLHAMCFDLIPVVIDSKYHKPEFDYLNERNSIILNEFTDEGSYAAKILSMYEKEEELISMKQGVWETISHLTIENMANNFSEGVKKILNEG